MYDEWSREVRGAPHARCGDTNKVSPRLRCAVIWRTAWSSPGAPHRGGGLPVSEPGLGADTHDLSPTIGRAPSHRNVRLSSRTRAAGNPPRAAVRYAGWPSRPP